jgi:hypothetical protein
LDYTSTG